MRTFDEISKARLPHNALTTNIALRACLSASQPQPAVALLRALLGDLEAADNRGGALPADKETVRLADALLDLGASEGSLPVDEANALRPLLARVRAKLSTSRRRD